MILIAIMSCERDAANGCHAAVRETWLRRPPIGVETLFFIGRGKRPLERDEVRLDVPDDYDGLVHKSRAIRRWALERGCSFAFKADRDTYLNLARLLHSGYEQHDYCGHFPGFPVEGAAPTSADGRGRYPYASGGCGYWTSARAMRLLADTEIDARALDNRGKPAEDLWAANILIPSGIVGWHDPRYLFRGECLHDADAISVHLSRGTGLYSPEWMRRAHRYSRQ